LAVLEAGREHTDQQEYDRVVEAICNELGEKVDAILALGAEWTEDGAVASP
jgi:hypothetical protein